MYYKYQTEKSRRMEKGFSIYILVLIVSVSARNDDNLNHLNEDSDEDLFPDLFDDNEFENQGLNDDLAGPSQINNDNHQETDSGLDYDKEFVESKLEDFKRIGHKSYLMIPYLQELYDYIKRANLKFLFDSLRDIVRNYNIYIQKPTYYLENVNNFARLVIEYKNHSKKALSMLESAIEYIQKRIDSIKEIKFKRQLLLIKNCIEYKKQLFQSISPKMSLIFKAVTTISDVSEEVISNLMIELEDIIGKTEFTYKNNIIIYKINDMIKEIEKTMKGKSKIQEKTLDDLKIIDDDSIEKLRSKIRKINGHNQFTLSSHHSNNYGHQNFEQEIPEEKTLLQVKREGKTLINKELDKFKQNSRKQTIQPYLIHLKQYIKRANSKFLSKLIIEIHDMFSKYYTEEDKKEENYKSFMKLLQVYRNHEETLIYRLGSCLQWISVRLFYIEEALKPQMRSIQTDLETTREFYNSVSKVLLPLSEKVTSLVDMESTQVIQMMQQLNNIIQSMGSNDKTNVILQKITELENEPTSLTRKHNPTINW